MIPFSHLVLFYIAATSAENAPRLLQVQIIIRHADRAPLYEFTSSESAKLFPRGLGEVTNEGLLNAAQQGESFQQRYGPLIANDNEIYVRSSPTRRTLMSAYAFAVGFTGKGSTPIHTTENLEDEQVLNVQRSIEYSCKLLARFNISGQPLCRTEPLIGEFIKEYKDCASFPYTKIEAAIAEVEHPAARFESALEKCARGDGRKIQFRATSIRPGVGAEFDLSRARTVIGPLMSIVKRNVDDVIRSALTQEQQRTSVRLYYTHDHIILATAQALGIISEYGGRSPAFSSAIAVEIWSSNEGFEVKIMMKDGLHTPFKHVATYRFFQFKQILYPYTLSNVQWDENVQKVYTYMDFDSEPGPDLNDSMVIEKARRITRGATMIYKIVLFTLFVLIAARFVLQKQNSYARMF